MKIIVDSREKWTQAGNSDRHIKDYFEKNNIEYEVRKLDEGDYQIEGNPGITIDRKKNLEEVASNLMNRKDKSRFWKEVRRCNEKGMKMIVLVEHSRNITCMQDVAKWNSKFSPVAGRNLMDEIFRVCIAYGIEFQFCSRKETGKRIVELLLKG